jgi:hypothetical protein
VDSAAHWHSLAQTHTGHTTIRFAARAAFQVDGCTARHSPVNINNTIDCLTEFWPLVTDAESVRRSVTYKVDWSLNCHHRNTDCFCQRPAPSAQHPTLEPLMVRIDNGFSRTVMGLMMGQSLPIPPLALSEAGYRSMLGDGACLSLRIHGLFAVPDGQRRTTA